LNEHILPYLLRSLTLELTEKYAMQAHSAVNSVASAAYTSSSSLEEHMSMLLACLLAQEISKDRKLDLEKSILDCTVVSIFTAKFIIIY